MSEYAIRIRQLGKRYKLFRRPIDRVFDAFGLTFLCRDAQEFWALRYLDLDIRHGERVGLIGRNGAGKSTLLKMIIGNITPTEGSLDVEGSVQALMELGTGFHPEFTGRQNIRASLSYYGLSNKFIAELEEDIVDFAELEDFIDQPVKTYSAGMYARLAFSTATSIRPELLIIDEVLGAGDAYFAGKSVERMKRLTENSGTTVLFVSHDLSSVLSLCERVIWIDRGRIRMDGPPMMVVKEYSSMIRQEEEYRLRARELRVAKKQSMLLESREELYQSLLFHFDCPAGVSSENANRIYGVRLAKNGKPIGAIDVGAPMDNVPEQLHYIMDAKGYMDWGVPLKDGNGTYRAYRDMKGRYEHAPFSFSIPRTELVSGGDWVLEVDALVTDEGIRLEVFDDGGYKTLGVVEPGVYGTQRFAVNAVVLGSSGAEQELDREDSGSSRLRVVNSADEYGHGGAKIMSVKMYRSDGAEARVFEVGDSLKVEIGYEADMDLVRPFFVFCVYSPDGKCASQWGAGEEEYGRIRLPARGEVSFFVDHLMLGRGQYVASAAIFKEVPSPGTEAESYHVLDRCIHFEVKQKIREPIERGLCVQPYRVSAT